MERLSTESKSEGRDSCLSEPLSDSGCKRCPLWETASHICILGDGPLDSNMLVLGIGPGRTENQKGSIFAGKSGRLLRSALFENGLNPRIENVVRCWPPENRDPTKDEILACSVYLSRVVAQMPNLKYVVALGTIVMGVCGVKGSVIKLAGVPRSGEAWGKKLIVIPLMHPAGLMRRPSYFSTWMSHWHQIRELVHPREVSFSEAVGAELYPDGLQGKDWRSL